MSTIGYENPRSVRKVEELHRLLILKMGIFVGESKAAINIEDIP